MSWKPEELAYCTNVHAGESLTEISDNLDRFVGPVRRRAHIRQMSAGLWISNNASVTLGENAVQAQLKSKLKANNLTLHSINGFPYGNFHQKSVKEAVYSPDWSDAGRLEYTTSLAAILANCLQGDEYTGTISTLPLGFRKHWTEQRHKASLRNLLTLAERLHALECSSGRYICVCLEMEPACVLEKTSGLIQFFHSDLMHSANEQGINPGLVFRYIGVCYDVCHQAVMFEDIDQSLESICRAGIKIGKIQLSNALRINNPDLENIRQQLKGFDEPRYLHQTGVRLADGVIVRFDDLDRALSSITKEKGQEWRIHYHVPLQITEINRDGLSTTYKSLDAVFSFLSRHRDIKPHLEIETYTWNVLPPALRPKDDRSLIKGIDGELQFVISKLQQHALLDE